MKFEWDENKNKINIRKHGISFDEATLVFNDEYRMEIYDKKHSLTEDRYRIIGRVNEILCVIVTYRRNDITRIISARDATPQEGREYLWQ